MKTIDRNPELLFLDVDLLDLRRELKATNEWTRSVVAGCLSFVGGLQENDPDLPTSASQSTYRTMLRRLIELDRVPPPRRATMTAATKRRSGSSVGRAHA